MTIPITTKSLQDLEGTSNLVVIDIRPVEAYNGWRLCGEARGGHIAGAKSMPARWSTYIDWPDIVRAKGIDRDSSVVVYGYDRAEADVVAARLSRIGITAISVYDGFLDEWSADPSLPMERLERYRQLVSPEWLHTLLAAGTAPERDANNPFVVCHAHYRNKGAYDEGHIPGAIAVDTNDFESPETWNRRSPGELKRVLESLGITHDTTVILYGRFSFPHNDDPFPGSSAGHLGAIRCAFIMMYAGVRDVRVLNGGLRSWTDAGYELSTEETAPNPVDDFGTAIPAQPELAVDLSDAKQLLADAHANLVCVRSWPEYIGAVSGYNYIEKKGRIPGAVFGNCGSDAYHMENYRNLDHTTREFHEIEHSWREAGITPDKHNAFYCGTGWRASEAFLNAWLMGWPRVSVFDGGWFEWSNDESNPWETGEPIFTG